MVILGVAEVEFVLNTKEGVGTLFGRSLLSLGFSFNTKSSVDRYSLIGSLII